MNRYITGSIIKKLREQRNLTQLSLAKKLTVSDKTVSKWETGKGFPDISLIEPLAKELNVSVSELLSGEIISNSNISANMSKIKFYACPVCRNVIQSIGDTLVSCCGVTLPPLEAEECDGEHKIEIRKTEDEFFISVDHSMTKNHYISFIAFVSSDKVNFIKLYPEGNAQTRISIREKGELYILCNRHGLYKKTVSPQSCI